MAPFRLDPTFLGEIERLVSGDPIRRPRPIRDRWGRWHRDPAGEFDWFYALPKSEQTYIAGRYMAPAGQGGVQVDVLASAVEMNLNDWAEAFVAAVRASRDRKAAQYDAFDERADDYYCESDSDEETLMGPDEVADLLQVQRATLRQWRKRGELPEPYMVLSGMPIWQRGAVVAFALLTGRDTLETEQVGEQVTP